MRQKPNVQMAVLMLAMFLHYLAMVLPMAGIALLVGHQWAMSDMLVGAVTGAAFFCSMLLRKYGGSLCLAIGARACYFRGTLLYASSGIVCLGAVVPALPLWARFGLLLAGRCMVGVSEAVTNVGMSMWSVDVMGVHRSGRVFANLGLAMYGAAAVGGHLGFWIFSIKGFEGLLAVSIVCPLCAHGLARLLPATEAPFAPPVPGQRRGAPLREILPYILPRGIPTICHSVGFIVIGSFLAKTFIDRGWPDPGLGFTCYGIGFVLMRVFVGHLPDKYGGVPVTAASGVLETAGLFLLWLAPEPRIALAGALLTGAGCSMIFPALGMDIAKTVPVRLRSSCISMYNMFIDCGYALGGPAAGLVADRFGGGSPYVFAALCSLCGLALIVRLWCAQRRAPKPVPAPGVSVQPGVPEQSFEQVEQLDAASAALTDE